MATQVAEQRQPRGIIVNGAYLFVKDPNAAAGKLFSAWQRVTGLSSFTLPAEVGGTNETQLQDGVLATAQLAGVGTITGAIGGRGLHVSHRFMEARKADGEAANIAIVKPCLARAAIIFATGTVVADPSSDAKLGRIIEVPTANRADVRRRVRAGDLVAIAGADADTAVDAAGALAPTNVLDYDGAQAAAGWQYVVYVERDGSFIDVAPGFGAALTIASSKYRAMYIRTPGLKSLDIAGVINGFDGGDWQNGQFVAGNFTFTPEEVVAPPDPEIRTPALVAALYTPGVGYEAL